MKTYLAEIIPKIKRFSKKIDDLSLLNNQHWVLIDEIENSKSVYIFRSNNDLLISINGRINKAKWEHLGSESLIIEIKGENYLFKIGFFDDNILALKIDGKQEYAFLVNETRFTKEINSIDDVITFLNIRYKNPNIEQLKDYISITDSVDITLNKNKMLKKYECSQGRLEIEVYANKHPYYRDRAFLNNGIAPNGKYKIGMMFNIYVKNGLISNISPF